MFNDILKDIRTRCRLSMNGVVSASMREKGLNYKLNFGLSTLEIKKLAEYYTPNKELAESLWKEDTRELKILSTLLYPISEFTKSRALEWLDEAHNQEIKEQLCFNLLQFLDYAPELVIESCSSSKENLRIGGYLLLCRLIIAKKLTTPFHSDSLSFVYEDISSSISFSLQNTAVQSLKFIGKQSMSESRTILDNVKLKGLTSIYDDLYSDFEFISYPIIKDQH